MFSQSCQGDLIRQVVPGNVVLLGETDAGVSVVMVCITVVNTPDPVLPRSPSGPWRPTSLSLRRGGCDHPAFVQVLDLVFAQAEFGAQDLGGVLPEHGGPGQSAIA
jgi:hypothetical protein